MSRLAEDLSSLSPVLATIWQALFQVLFFAQLRKVDFWEIIFNWCISKLAKISKKVFKKNFLIWTSYFWIEQISS